MIKMTQFAMKNVAAIMILMILLLFGGMYSTSTLKVESMPDISFPVVMVSTPYKAPPTDVLDKVTKPLEKSLANMKGLKNLTSTSSDNFSTIIVELTQGTKLDDAKKDIESLIANVKIPDSAEKPKVMTFGFASQPVYYSSIYGEEGMNQAELDNLFKNVIEPGLNSIPGLDHIDAIGNQEAKLNIRLDARALGNYGLSVSQVVSEIQSNLTSSPAGSVKFNGSTEMVRVTGEMNTIYNLDRMLIGTPRGESIELSQIAKVESISESSFYARLDGRPAIGLHLYKTKDANAVEFGDAVQKQIANWETTLPGVSFHEIFTDSKEIKKSINGMVKEGALGALLASLMILVFLRNIRMTFIVLISIPLSILLTLLLMAPLGVTLNIMTLGGLAIAVGRVVDDSIVVIENVYSRLAKAQERGESVILLATKQVSAAITSSTLTTVGVFAPIGFVGGVVGEVFRPFALTLACALMASLLVALTVIPMLAKLLVIKSTKIPHHDENHVGKFAMQYKKILAASLNHKMKTLLAAGLLFILSVVLIVPRLASEFMPASESDKKMYFMIEMPKETSLEAMDAKMKEIESMLMNAKDATGNPQFIFVESLVGYNFSNDAVPYNSAMFTEVAGDANASVVLKEYQEKIRYELPQKSKVDGSLISFGGGGGGGANFSYSLKGDDLLLLKQAAATIQEEMKKFPELSEVKDSLGETKMEVKVLVNQNKAQLYGMSTGQVLGAAAEWIGKRDLGDMKFDNVMYKTTIEMDQAYKDSLEKLENIPIQTPTGEQIRLADIASVRHIDSPVSIAREKEQQVVNVTAKIEGKDKGGISAKVQAALDQVELPSGVGRDVTGVSDDINESFGQMFVAMGASIFIVYLIMVLAFGNAGAPFAILFSLPLAVIGGLLGLFVTGESLNVTSLIGFLMLIGIVVTNAIVLIDRVQQLREDGYEVRDALIEAGMNRLRPIIMTAGATIFALLPLGLGMSEGTLISKGLAVVVIGGLITSTLLTLVVVPIVYETIHSIKMWTGRLFRRKTKQADAPTIAS
ncbi:efflux RND transporter permease subunit [Cohnella terricola]|uniref:Efflux RND transporter permease subunit n=1 Tax=Cohnella terricola TaxID=1289167 RepID=A0A559JIQ2_9BACL|nr:efflux RND transporter permease subunit [Cohnella terricola]TVX99748.1 efflux RND transporter permease subunit [Cohnella terricola]